MPKNNQASLCGRIASEPYFTEFDQEKPYLRFFLVVPRSQEQMPKRRDGRRIQDTDLIRVVRYGLQAKVDYYYLQKGALVAVTGWVQSRRYEDKHAKKMRGQIEINARNIVYSTGCDFERGDRWRHEIAASAGVEPESLSSAHEIPVDLLAQLSAEVDAYGD